MSGKPKFFADTHCMVSCDADFRELHFEWVEQEKDHAGIIHMNPERHCKHIGELVRIILYYYAITYIVSTPDVVGGKPRIDGTRISVQFLSMFLDGSRSVEDLREDYGLTPAQIHAAWSYYYDHKAEIDQTIEEAENFVRPDAAEYEAKIETMKKRYKERQKLASEG